MTFLAFTCHSVWQSSAPTHSERSQRYEVRVPDALIDDLKRRIDDIATDSGYAGRVVLIPDPAMSGNDCRLEWVDGGAVRSVDTILNDIETGIVRILQKPIDHSGDPPADPANNGADQPSAEPQ